MSKWFVDNSRHMLGHTCPFARYLRYHHDGTGYSQVELTPELRMGTAIHENVERAYMWLQQGGPVPDKLITDEKLCQSTVHGYEDTVTALSHGYVRLVLPWINQNFTVVAVEPEMSLDLGYDITWMARPDVVVKSKVSGLHSIVEFKTTGARPEKMAALYKHSLQTLMNSYAVKQQFGSCEAVQIHIMQRGNNEWPTPLTHAYYRVANPPFVSEDWSPKNKRPDGSYVGKLYRKVQVSEHRPLPDWIWSMPIEVLSDYVPIIGNPLDPAEHGLKCLQAIASIVQIEQAWREKLALVRSTLNPTGAALAAIIPRTFNCVQYERSCDWYNACFNVESWQKPFTIPEGFIARTPHHMQEILQNIIEKKK